MSCSNPKCLLISVDRTSSTSSLRNSANFDPESWAKMLSSGLAAILSKMYQTWKFSCIMAEITVGSAALCEEYRPHQTQLNDHMTEKHKHWRLQWTWILWSLYVSARAVRRCLWNELVKPSCPTSWICVHRLNLGKKYVRLPDLKRKQFKLIERRKSRDEKYSARVWTKVKWRLASPVDGYSATMRIPLNRRIEKVQEKALTGNVGRLSSTNFTVRMSQRCKYASALEKYWRETPASRNPNGRSGVGQSQ